MQPSQSNAFGVVTHLSGLATAITKSTPKDPNTYWSDADTVTVDGITITLQAIRSGTAQLVDDTYKVLLHDVFMGLPLQLAPLSQSHIIDHMQCYRTDYSLWTEPMNSFHNGRNALLDRVLMRETDEVFHHGLVGNDKASMQIIWDPNVCKKWLAHCEQFLKSLSSLFKITAGQPPRDSETQQTLITNNPWRRRSLMAIPNHLLWILEYNKTRAVTHHDEFIVRVLPEKVEMLTMLWIQYGIPLYEKIIHSFYGSDAAAATHYVLFAGRQGVWNPAAFSQAFQQSSLKYFRVQIGTATWRQMAVAIRQRHISSPRLAPILNVLGDEDLPLYEDDIGAVQVGHSVPTEQRHYASVEQMLKGTPSEIFALFVEVM